MGFAGWVLWQGTRCLEVGAEHVMVIYWTMSDTAGEMWKKNAAMRRA
jgi:hypothetical protein